MMIDYAKTLEALRLLFDVDNLGVYRTDDRDIVLSTEKTYPTGNRCICIMFNLHCISSNRFRYAVNLTKSGSTAFALSSKFFEMLPHKRFISFDDEVFHEFLVERETVIKFMVDELLELLKPGGDGVYIGTFVHNKNSGRLFVAEKLYSSREIKNISYEELMIMYDLNM